MTVQAEQHEAFKNRLVEDVFGSDAGDKVPMEKVVMLLWQFRDDPSVITFMARFVSKYAGSRDVFDGIEFYLPQLAHMIIHLEVDWDDAVLERFALVIAQQSLHFALQLNWILQGALQDYQPELSVEDSDSAVCAEPNPNYNPVFYSRCLKLLRNLERCVVYGKPRAAALQKLYEQGKISMTELVLLEQADRRFNALQITAAEDDKAGGAEAFQTKLDGWVDVQLPLTRNKVRKAKEKKVYNVEYVKRFCSLDKHVLNCYKAAGSCCSTTLQLERAMSLERATIARDRKRNPTVLKILTRNYQFRLRFEKVEEANLWMRRIQEEADTTSLFHNSLKKTKSKRKKRSENGSFDDSEDTESSRMRSSGEAMLKQDLTPAQLDRYEFFQNERDFVQSLTDLAEELRDCDRAERKILAPQKVAELTIPASVYLPLCNSSTVWRRVDSPVPDETRVFNTKERCPVIIHFLTKRGEWHRSRSDLRLKADPNLDVAEFMHNYFEVTSGHVDVMEGIAETTKEEEADESVEMPPNENDEVQRNSQHGGKIPYVWNEEDDQDPATPTPAEKNTSPQRGAALKGNRKVQRLLRESVVVLPSILAKRLKPVKHDSRRNRLVTFLDRQTEMQPRVPILDDRKRDDDAASVGESSVVSVGRSSVLIKDQIVLGDLDEGDIDLESIDRAKKLISGGESWAEKSAKMLEKALQKDKLKHSDQGNDETIQSEITSCMSKSNDDLRQEVFVMQMIHFYKSLFAKANLPLWLKTYRILSTSSSTGLLEVLTDATSLDGLKKSEGYPVEGGLRKYFEVVYNGPDSDSFREAQRNFMQSLAGYAIVSYLLGLKDRHNGNIMIDTRGHLIYIDFGFAMGMAPGHEFSMERAPFKFTKEFVEVLGGVGSPCYKDFERLFVAGIVEARKNSQIALGMVEIMMFKSNYPCFSGWRYGNGKALTLFEKRLMLKVPDDQVERRALRLINKARGNMGTYLYDKFQHATNGYAM